MGKKKIPRAVYILGAVALAVPLLGWLAFSKLPGGARSKPDSGATQAQASAAPVQKAAGPMTAREYVASHVPRIPGLPHTAARFDAVTAPTEAPYPAACVQSKRGCDCYTQQGTKLLTPADLCKQIVAGGFFMDWKGKEQSTGHANGSAGAQAGHAPANAPAASPGAVAVAPGRGQVQASASAWNFTGGPTGEQYSANDAQDVDAMRFMRNRRR